METKEKFIELASEFRRTELWEDLTDSDVFGVELEDGRHTYCCVMGNSGIHRGLGVYVGERGFRTYLDQINKDHADDRKVVFDRMATFEDMQVTFDEKGTVQWWSHHPHLVPSQENSTEEELGIMCQALNACICLRRLIDEKDGDVVSLGFDEYEEYPTREGGKEALLMRPEGQGYSCGITQLPAYDRSDEERLRRMSDDVVRSGRFVADLSLLQGLRKAGTLQCRLIHSPVPVKENDESPGFYPLWLLTVNKGDGRIVPTEVVRIGDDEGVYHMLANLCEALYRQGHLPLQISVPNEATEALLRFFCQRVGIKLVRERLPLRELNEAWQGMFEYFEREEKQIIMRDLEASGFGRGV